MYLRCSIKICKTYKQNIPGVSFHREKKYTQKYSKQWEQDKYLKDFLYKMHSPHKCTSSFNGQITEIPGISVDNFEHTSRAYFLSHHHQDHVAGLYTPKLLMDLDKTNASIYCTKLSAAIIAHECRLKGRLELTKFVKGLDYGSTLVTLPEITKDGNQIPELFVTLTLIPAGHSAGSAMLLFKTTQTTVLFTGDFRINSNDLLKYKSLHDGNIPIKIDTLYIDTTFLYSQYKEFPKRSDSIEVLLQDIREYLKTDGNAVALHTSAKYGYEYVFNAIYRELNLKVYVTNDKWDLYSTVKELVPGVTNKMDEDIIHLCRNKSENKAHLCVNNSYKNYLYVHLSAMKWTNYKDGDRPVANLNGKRIDVCFSTHCSAKEIMDFKNHFKPNKVVGFPNKFKEINFDDGIKRRRLDESL